MTCTRCQGCMTRDHFIDLWESAESMWMDGWRCLNCGNVRDPVMEQNRRGQRTSPVVSTARVPGLTRPKHMSMSSQASGLTACHVPVRCRGHIALRPASSVPVRFPMFSCHVVEAGLDFLHTPWHEQKHQNHLVRGPKLPRLKSSPVASDSSRNFLHRWKTLVEKASHTSTQPGPEQSCNSVSAFAARLARNLPSFKSIGTTSFLWVTLRRRNRASPLSRPLLPRLSRRNVIFKEDHLRQQITPTLRLHQYPHAHR